MQRVFLTVLLLWIAILGARLIRLSRVWPREPAHWNPSGAARCRAACHARRITLSSAHRRGKCPSRQARRPGPIMAMRSSQNRALTELLLLLDQRPVVSVEGLSTRNDIFRAWTVN